MNGSLNSLPSKSSNGLVHVIIDTPKGSRSKFKYDEKIGIFRLSRILPIGTFFPYDFGSIPQTLAEDGDALDVMILSDSPSFVGCLMTTKLIGIISAEQTENGRTIRNDRLMGVPVTDVNPAKFEPLVELSEILLDEIEYFFVSYNRAQQREFRPIKREGPVRAHFALLNAEQRYFENFRGEKQAEINCNA